MDINTLLAVIQHLESRKELYIKRCDQYKIYSYDHYAYDVKIEEVLSEINYLTGIVDSIREENKS